MRNRHSHPRCSFALALSALFALSCSDAPVTSQPSTASDGAVTDGALPDAVVPSPFVDATVPDAAIAGDAADAASPGPVGCQVLDLSATVARSAGSSSSGGDQRSFTAPFGLALPATLDGAAAGDSAHVVLTATAGTTTCTYAAAAAGPLTFAGCTGGTSAVTTAALAPGDVLYAKGVALHLTAAAGSGNATLALRARDAACGADVINVWKIVPPDVTVTTALALAAELPIPNPVATETASTIVVRPGPLGPLRADAPPAPLLLVDKASGVVRFRDPAALAPVTMAPMLPTDAGALQMANAFLSSVGRLPPHPRVSVARVQAPGPGGALVDVGVGVRLVPQLLSSPMGPLVPVLGAEVTVVFGASGKVVSLDARHRPVALDRTVARLPEDAARARLAASVPACSAADPTVCAGLALRYQVGSPHDSQAFLDPGYATVDDDGVALAHAAATDFSPRVQLVAPQPESVVNGAGAISFQVMPTAGTPPYTLTWSSNHAVLGTGATLEARLPNGRREVTLTVKDANGSTAELSFPVIVTGSSTPDHSGHGSTPTPAGPAIDEVTDGDFSALVLHDGARARPVLANARFGTDLLLDSVAFEQFRYKIGIKNDRGQQHHLRSNKCIDGRLSGDGACNRPAAPFAKVAELNNDRVVIDRLPGKLTLTFHYRPEHAYCGPTPGLIGRGFATFVTITGLIRPLGGTCPGVVPEVRWTYEEPYNLTCEEVKKFCDENPGVNDDGDMFCDVPASELADCNGSSSPGPQPSPSPSPMPRRWQVYEFEASLYTAKRPFAPALPAMTTLVRDGASETSLAATDGAIDRTHQRLLMPGDAFVYINPMARERTASVATPTSRGEWDNFHAKAFPGRPVSFPGCNDPLIPELIPSACVHLHESWLGGPTYSQGQTVNWLVVRDSRAEESPLKRPTTLVNGEDLTAPVTDAMLWHESRAWSHQCQGNTSVGNAANPCRVFTSPIFFTH